MKIRDLPWGVRITLILLLAMGEVAAGVLLGLSVAEPSFSWAILPPLILAVFLMPEEFPPLKK